MTDETATALSSRGSTETSGEPAIRVVREWQEVWHRFAANRLALLGLVLVVALLVTAASHPG